MDTLKRLYRCGIVPVVVIEDSENAVPTAKALLAGGIDVMEITFRTPAAKDSIKKVAENMPEVLVGAGTVLTIEQANDAVNAGAKFIVSPGFDEELVKWCLEKNVAVVPGCVTPSEIQAALKLGVNVLKFFPANIYGGLAAMKALSAPFGKVKFIPTGGVNGDNMSEYMSAPYIFAVGGSWICPKADISAGNFDKITELSKKARDNAMGFEIAHIGINQPDSDASMEVCKTFNSAFGFPIKKGNSSNFTGTGIEVMKTMFRGQNGHIALRTNNIERAVAYLENKGFKMDFNEKEHVGEYPKAIYLKDEIGGFGVHLLQK